MQLVDAVVGQASFLEVRGCAKLRRREAVLDLLEIVVVVVVVWGGGGGGGGRELQVFRSGRLGTEFGHFHETFRQFELGIVQGRIVTRGVHWVHWRGVLGMFRVGVVEGVGGVPRLPPGEVERVVVVGVVPSLVRVRVQVHMSIHDQLPVR